MMDNDRELLERAAKAAGITLSWPFEKVAVAHGDDKTPSMPWDPLGDDGDALRLAVKVGINVFRGMAEPPYREPYPGRVFESESSVNADPYAATRRAVVRAAAAIEDAK
jgi:hypothetical protein